MNDSMALEIILDAKARIDALEKAGITIKEIAKIVNDAKARFKEFTKNLISQSKEIVKKGFEVIKKSAITMANAVSKSLKVIEKGFTRIVAVTSLAGGALLKFASDAKEMENKFNVVFGSMSKEVDKWAKDYGNAINRSKNTIKDMLAENQNLFVGFGMSRSEASEFSKQVVMLTNDLSSFNNLNPTKASELMISALQGQSMAATSLGASIKEVQLHLSAQALGYEKYNAKMDEATKMQIRFNAILMQSPDALGDSIRTAWDFANLSKGIFDNLKQLGSTLGSYLIPTAEGYGATILTVIKNTTNWIEENDEVVKVIVEMSIEFLKFIGTIFLVVKALMLLSSPAFLAVTAITALYIAWDTNLFGIRESLQGLIDFIENHKILALIFGITAFTLSPLIFQYSFKLLGKGLSALVKEAVTGAGLTYGGLSTGLLATGLIGIGWTFSKVFGDKVSLTEFMEGSIKKTQDLWNNAKFKFKLFFGLWGKDEEVFGGSPGMSGLEKAFIDMKENILSIWTDIGNGINSVASKISNSVSSVLNIDYSQIKTGDGYYNLSSGYSSNYRGGLIGYDTGGYTGEGGKYDVAGVVHRGEYVIPKWQVKKNKGLISALESQRLKGFDGGGGTDYVGYIDQAKTYLQENGKDQESVQKYITMLEGIESLIVNLQESINNLSEEKKKLEEEFKNTLDKLKKATDDAEAEKEKEAFLKSLTEFSSSLSTVAEQLDSDFLRAINLGTNGITNVMNSLTTFSQGGLLNQISGGLGIAGAIIGVVQGVTSMLDASNEKDNQEQLRIYEKNTKALEELSETMSTMGSNFTLVSKELLKNLSSNPTLSRTSTVNDAYTDITDAMMANKHFGQISFVADYKKERFLRSSKHKKETFTLGGNIDDLSYENLKKYREGLNQLSTNDFADIAKGNTPSWNGSDWGDALLDGLMTGGTNIWAGLFGYGDYKFNGIKSNNLDQYKANIDEFLASYEKILQEQEKLLETSTLESFQGVSKIAEDELREQYENMYSDMGLDPSEYKENIEEMVEANQILITATDDVRSSFISAMAEGKKTGEAILESMSSYISKMLNNISSVLYDTLFSDFDTLATDYFEKFSNMLVEVKKNNKDVFKELQNFLNGVDTSEFINNLVDVSKLNQNLDGFIRTLRERLKKAGLSETDIDSLELIDSVRQQTLEVADTVKSSLKNAMSEALDNNDLESFRSSLGKSIYESAKKSLIQAFSESAIYQKMFQAWFNAENISFTGDLDKDLATMQNLLSDLDTELKKNNLDFSSDSGNSNSSSSNSNTYYTATSSSSSSSGATTVEKHFHFDFSNTNIYDKEEMKDFIKKTINETKEA